MTPAQWAVLRTWLDANAAALSDEQARDALNAAASPVYRIYRSAAPVSEMMQNGFDWTRVDNMSIGKARVWEWLTDRYAPEGGDGLPLLNFAKPNNRAAINEVWKGTAADLAVRAVVYSHGFRNATVAETLFSTGAGTAPDGEGNGPGTTTFEGLVTTDDVIEARR